MEMAAETLLSPLQSWVEAEALAIFRWWADHMVDRHNGGFHGEVDPMGAPVADAPKGVILAARLLWYFSEMAMEYRAPDLIGPEAGALAQQAFTALISDFTDTEHGGLYWMVDASGGPVDTKKQGYAQAFGIYALSAYYRMSRDPEALRLAHALMMTLEARFRDTVRGGYIEATTREWGAVSDQRLSDRDADCPKTMNTHLHILEAYTALYRAAPDAATEAVLRRIISVFSERFVNSQTGHLNLFFDMDWGNHTRAVSFGHDIEASWLLWEAAETLGDAALLETLRPVVLRLTEITLTEAMRPDGGVMYERGFDGHLDASGEWWGQAEALVGFLNACQLSARPEYFTAVARLMDYIVREHKTAPASEWSWYPRGDGRVDPYLGGLWKCPYHNGRAMLELRHRLQKI